MEKELSKAISYLKSNKSSGLDNISNNMIKFHLPMNLNKFLMKGSNYSFFVNFSIKQFGYI
jgi:hypothetical protein